jgi:hypothetical protein
MVRVLCCWHCQMEIPMLENQEAAYVLGRGDDRDGILSRLQADRF